MNNGQFGKIANQAFQSDMFAGVRQHMGQLNELTTRYSNYTLVNQNQLPFREPENGVEAACCKKVKTKNAGILALITLVMLALFVVVIIQGTGLLGISMIGMFFVITALLLVSTLTKKPMILDAMAVYKYATYDAGKSSSNNNSLSYFATVIIERPQKLLCDRIRLTKSIYNKLQEGEIIYVVCVGDTICGVTSR